MLCINGYKIITSIYETTNSIVYRGIRQEDNQPVILKVLKQDYPTPAQLTRYRQEYEITCNLNLEGVIKAYRFDEFERKPAIAFEDFGGVSLKTLINSSGDGTNRQSLQQFLPIAIKIAGVLGVIPTANVIHKDINPANIIFNPETGQLKIIDFGISTQLSRENPT